MALPKSRARLRGVPPIAAERVQIEGPRRGRPPWEPTKRDRDEATNLFRGNVPLFRVAEYFGKDEDTIKLHFSDEMRQARFKMFQTAVSKLLLNIHDKDQRAIEFFLNTQGKEFGFTTRTEHTGAGGEAIKTVGIQIDPEKLKSMEPDEIDALERALGKLFGSTGGNPGGATVTGDATAFAAAIDGRKK